MYQVICIALIYLVSANHSHAVTSAELTQFWQHSDEAYTDVLQINPDDTYIQIHIDHFNPTDSFARWGRYELSHGEHLLLTPAYKNQPNYMAQVLSVPPLEQYSVTVDMGDNQLLLNTDKNNDGIVEQSFTFTPLESGAINGFWEPIIAEYDFDGIFVLNNLYVHLVFSQDITEIHWGEVDYSATSATVSLLPRGKLPFHSDVEEPLFDNKFVTTDTDPHSLTFHFESTNQKVYQLIQH